MSQPKLFRILSPARLTRLRYPRISHRVVTLAIKNLSYHARFGMWFLNVQVSIGETIFEGQLAIPFVYSNISNIMSLASNDH